MSMDCTEARESVSARVDGELDADASEALEEHLIGCRECSAWESQVIASARRDRLQVAPSGSAGAVPRAPARAGRNRLIRIALGWAGVLLVAWHVPEMLSAGSDVAVHLSRHQAGFAVGLGAAFVFVAIRPDRAYGVIPFVATFTVVLVAVAVADLVNGSSTASVESRHLLEIGGLVLVWMLGTEMGPGRGVGDRWREKLRLRR